MWYISKYDNTVILQCQITLTTVVGLQELFGYLPAKSVSFRRFKKVCLDGCVLTFSGENTLETVKYHLFKKGRWCFQFNIISFAYLLQEELFQSIILSCHE